MTQAEIATVAIASLSLLVSLFTAYRTMLARFAGRVGHAPRVILTRIAGVPSIELACFFENSGAKPGTLDDLRLKVIPQEGGEVSYFYPELMRNDYNTRQSYDEANWYPQVTILLAARDRVERYIVFKPLSNRFTAKEGALEVLMQCRWHRSKRWSDGPAQLKITLTKEDAEIWNNPISGEKLLLPSETLRQMRREI
jgi:hypothetical protein